MRACPTPLSRSARGSQALGLAFCHGPIDRSSTGAAGTHPAAGHLPRSAGDRVRHQRGGGRGRDAALPGAAGARRRPQGRRSADRPDDGRVHRARDRAGAAVRHPRRPLRPALAAGVRPRGVRDRRQRGGAGAFLRRRADPARRAGHRRECTAAAHHRADQRPPAGRAGNPRARHQGRARSRRHDRAAARSAARSRSCRGARRSSRSC